MATEKCTNLYLKYNTLTLVTHKQCFRICTHMVSKGEKHTADIHGVTPPHTLIVTFTATRH